MGRYYSGMIEGKFWFGVQSSDAADRFGGFRSEPNYIDYYFGEDDLPQINQELQSIEEKLGGAMQKLNDFFEKTNDYNDQIMQEHNVLHIWDKHKENYADYNLGCKIRDCIQKEGYCEFQAEL